MRRMSDLCQRNATQRTATQRNAITAPILAANFQITQDANGNTMPVCVFLLCREGGGRLLLCET